MPIKIKGTRLKVSEELHAYALKRLGAVERMIKDGKVVFDVELAKSTNHHKKGEVYYAEANLEVDGTFYRATEEATTIEAAIDAVKDELLREMRKEKTRRTSKARQEEGRAKREIKGE